MSLEVHEVHTFYGLSHVLFALSLSVGERELVCLLGRNGVGKTTALKSIIGLVPPKSGSIKFRGEELIRKRPHQIVREGVCYVPADRRVYHELTVRENLEVGQRSRANASTWSVDKVYDLFLDLRKLDARLAGHLSGGERQMLSIGRALMGNPELLLLDEPTEGLAPLVVKTLEKQIIKLKEEGTSILLAEQNLKSALRISDRGYVISKGRVVFEGTIGALKGNEEAMKHLVL
jgi:branched-chain amino acid transport system ATP-binding protein